MTDHDDHADHDDDEDHHDDELPVFQWSQTEATILGFDAEARFELLTAAQGAADLVVGYDFVTTDVDDPHESHLPRIPRIGCRWPLSSLGRMSGVALPIRGMPTRTR